MKVDHEVLIIGAGPAGLSAAMTLGRLRRTALICDDNKPRNAPSAHINNFPSRDGVHPEEWRSLTRKDLKKYQTIKSIEGRILSVKPLKNGFHAQLSSGFSVTVKKVILAYGIKDKIPPILGFNELWGKAIFHCPFCHGFEVRGSKLGFMISNEMAFHTLPMIRSLSSDLIIFTNGKMRLNGEQQDYLNQKKIALVDEKIEGFQYKDENLKSINLADGQQIERQFLFYNPEMPFELKSDIGQTLGCKKDPFGLYETNEFGKTSVPGVFAAGDNMSMAQSVLLACASGVKTGSAVIAELLSEE